MQGMHVLKVPSCRCKASVTPPLIFRVDDSAVVPSRACRMPGSSSGLYSLGASSTAPQVVTTSHAPRHHQIPPGEQNCPQNH